MKKLLILTLITSAALFSCSKKSDNKPSNGQTVLLTKIIDNISVDEGYGKPIAEFTYDGKQLNRAVTYSYYSSDTYTVTTDFYYNSNGQLTGTTIAHSSNNLSDNDVRSVVSYSGNHISSIKFYQANNVLDRTVTLNYQNDLLKQYFDPTRVKKAYTYEANGNNTRESDMEYVNGVGAGVETAFIENYTFDTKSNLLNALPMWVYFISTDDLENFLPLSPGKNNPVSANLSGNRGSYSYQYNNYGYPSANSAALYEYIQVN